MAEEQQGPGFLALMKSLLLQGAMPGIAPSLQDTQKEELASGILAASNAALLNQTPRLNAAYEAAAATPMSISRFPTLSDAYTAASGGVPSIVDTQTISDAYSGGAQDAQATLEGTRAAYPGTTAAGALTGALMSPANKAYGLIKSVPTIAGRVATAAGLGAGEGYFTATGNPNATPEDKFKSSLLGSLFSTGGQALQEVARVAPKAGESLYLTTTGDTAGKAASRTADLSAKQAEKGADSFKEGIRLLEAEKKLPSSNLNQREFQTQLMDKASSAIGARSAKAMEIIAPIDNAIKKEYFGDVPGVLKLVDGPRATKRLERLGKLTDEEAAVRSEAGRIFQEISDAAANKGKKYGLKEWLQWKQANSAQHGYSVDANDARSLVMDRVNDTIDAALEAKGDLSKLQQFRNLMDEESKLLSITSSMRREIGKPQPDVVQSMVRSLYTTGGAGMAGAYALGGAIGAPAGIAAAIPLQALFYPRSRRLMADAIKNSPLALDPAAAGLRGTARGINALVDPAQAPAAEQAAPAIKIKPMDFLTGKAQLPAKEERKMSAPMQFLTRKEIKVEGDIAPLMQKFGDLRLAAAAQLSSPEQVQKAMASAKSAKWADVMKYLPREIGAAATAVGLEAGLRN